MNSGTRRPGARAARRARGGRSGTPVPLLTILLTCLSAPPRAAADHPAVSLGSGTSRAMNTESAIPLGRGDWWLGVRSEYVRFREYSDARLLALRRRDPDADLHSVESLLATSLGLFYGVTDDVTVGLRLPYLRRSGIREPGHAAAEGAISAAHTTGPGHAGQVGEVERLGEVDGLGDLGLFGQWRVLERRPWHLALLAGLDLPSGETSERASNGERVETEFQPGSGAVRGSLGLAGTWVAGIVNVDASTVYAIAGDGSRDTNLGDVFAYGLALSHRIGAHEHGGPHHPGEAHDHNEGHLLGWDVFLELNGEWREREVAGGVRDGNSGGALLWLSPGARLTVAGRVTLGVSVGIPIAEDLNGDQVKPSYRIVSSAGLVF